MSSAAFVGRTDINATINSFILMNRIIVFARCVPNKNHHLTPLSAHVLAGREDVATARDTRPGPPFASPGGGRRAPGLQVASGSLQLRARVSMQQVRRSDAAAAGEEDIIVLQCCNLRRVERHPPPVSVCPLVAAPRTSLCPLDAARGSPEAQLIRLSDRPTSDRQSTSTTYLYRRYLRAIIQQ